MRYGGLEALGGQETGDRSHRVIPPLTMFPSKATISVREFDMPQEFEIPGFLPQYWHWLSGIFF